MWDVSLDEFSAAVAEIEDPCDLWDRMVAFYADHGVPLVSYHRIDPETADVAERQAVMAHGFPKSWVEHYVEHNLVDHDPIVALSARTAKPFFWKDIRDLVDLTHTEDRMIRELEDADFGDGLSVQVHGPGLRNGYVGLGFGGPRPDLSTAQIFALQCAAQIAHLRYCELVPELDGLRDLSRREREVLSWIARGKSNGVIADILHVSRHTVDTIVRRIFEKLEVSDRTTAAIKALGNGLVTRN
ncbi:helix-turn-helix transcriptional regulator [Jannaschia aquimarina]|uniref:LuxR_2 protein n=1 Tax=Jannaschia aquimarina TaxID=935700 RepID=A0A0D1D740_9RHOB|nr:LuxR family transcriptional regulator [Jannaschia aquimarina]KIT15758.1 Transcriptional activator protein LuxR [Jannaschia aquimarina]SNT31927.1 LuxR family transcriptional regulator/LuxR family transcriptional regulator, quorum-sensing system regulator CciR [Jannaschia aquimarina]